jgi:hypothetical protein
MKPALVLIAALVAAACSHGRTSNLSPTPGAAEAGQVVVVRNNNLFGWGLSVKVTLDDAVVARVRAGEHVIVGVAPGLHTVGVASRGISIPVEPKRRYYFLISADDSQAGFGIERLDSGRGEEWLSKTTLAP